MSLDHLNAMIELNLTSTFLIVKACLAHISSGTIVNLARRGFETAAPVKCQATSEDAANLVLFLACDVSAFITGAEADTAATVLIKPGDPKSLVKGDAPFGAGMRTQAGPPNTSRHIPTRGDQGMLLWVGYWGR